MFHLEKISLLLLLGSILNGFYNECFRVLQLLTVQKFQCTDPRDLSEVGVIICKVIQAWIMKYLLMSLSWKERAGGQLDLHWPFLGSPLTFQVGGGKVETLMLSTWPWKGNAAAGSWGFQERGGTYTQHSRVASGQWEAETTSISLLCLWKCVTLLCNKRQAVGLWLCFLVH